MKSSQLLYQVKFPHRVIEVYAIDSEDLFKKLLELDVAKRLTITPEGELYYRQSYHGESIDVKVIYYPYASLDSL